MKKRSRVRRLARFVLRGGRRRVGAAGPLKKSPRYLLFDFDGTLGDTFHQGFEILNLLASEFGFRPLPPEELEYARDLSTSGLMKHLGISRMKLHKISKRGTEEIGKRIHTVQTFDGVPEMVRHLHNAGFRLGILTSNSEPNVRVFLKAQNLELFDFIESSSKLLGKGSVLRRLMKERHIKPKEILMIGDELRDIEAAHDVGVHMAAVTWGYNSRAALEAAEPDYLFETPAQIVAFLDLWKPCQNLE
ncbi:MAG: HAD-IA family hydrolase [Terrimicrobiaceae bacterium]